MVQVYLGLGSNIGDRLHNLSRSIDLLSQDRNIILLQKSSTKETEPVDYLDQPIFLNQIITIETAYSASELLLRTREIETAMGRVKNVPKGPRIIDIDILLYGNTINKSKTLAIPHPGIKKRRFILEHLIELTPSLKDPETGALYTVILARI